MTTKVKSHQEGETIRVFMIADQLGHPNGAIHGGTTYFLNTLPTLSRCGIDLGVCFLGQYHPAAKRLEERGVHPIFLGRSKWDPRAFLDVLSLVRQRCPHVLHLLSEKSDLLGRSAAALTGCSAIIHIHDMVPMSPPIRFLQHRLVRWTARALVVSRPVAEFAHTQWGVPRDRIEVLYNGLDQDRFRNPSADARERLRNEFQTAQDVPVVVLSGRVNPDKGQAEMVRAMLGLLSLCPDTVLWIVGTGPSLDACKALARDLQVETSVRFTGQRTDIPDVLAAADVCVVPSVWQEPFPYAVMEAQAAARPVVAFAVGGVPEMVTDELTGLLVPNGDIDALARILGRLVSDAALRVRLGQHATEEVKRFSVEEHVKRLKNLYESLAGRVGVPAST